MSEQKRLAAEEFGGGPDSLMIEVQTSDTLALSKTEIDLQISTAKNYPRNLVQFQKSTMQMVTYSREVADTLFYKLPRGGKIIEGPSVRFAEIVGQNWRNCRIGARTLGTDAKTVTSQGAFHDLETNVAITFEIKRRITKKDGTRYDDDMIGVTGAAAAGIAFRNAVLKGVPKMFWQPMYEKAIETARGDDKDIAPRRKAALESFDKMGVPVAAILKTLNVSGISKIGGDELLTLRGIYNAIREGTTTADEAFGLGPEPIEPTEEVADEAPKQKSATAEHHSKKLEKELRSKKKKLDERNHPIAKASDIPRAQIPKGSEDIWPKNQTIDVQPIKPETDPVISPAEQSKIYNAAVQHKWKVPDDVRAMLQQRFKVDSVRFVRRSQLDAVLKAVSVAP
jgi:hypothetical protein